MMSEGVFFVDYLMRQVKQAMMARWGCVVATVKITINSD